MTSLQNDFKDDTYYSIKAQCNCKSCTGNGLGWMKHLTPQQLGARTRRLRKQYLYDREMGQYPHPFH
ncbi:hypothetical protein D3C80_448520 [compost metagenome]